MSATQWLTSLRYLKVTPRKLSVIQCCLISCESCQEEDIVIFQPPQAPQTFKLSLVVLRTKSNFQYSLNIASGYQIISQYLHQMTMQPYGSQLLIQLVLSSHIRTPRELDDPITAACLTPVLIQPYLPLSDSHCMCLLIEYWYYWYPLALITDSIFYPP